MDSASQSIEKEHMFDKVVTPSDVGKLNRLVIPKQHAEKYFPLDSSANEKSLLLNFEDRNGKQWRFRYSYWNSSQSYVMTKGWSRFVKEMQLYAGDIVSFQRGVGELGKKRLFIDWQRRPDAAPSPATLLHHELQFQLMNFDYHSYHRLNSGSSYNIRPQHMHQSREIPSVVPDYPMVIDSVPIVRGNSAAKRLRLFGVNLECPINNETQCNVFGSAAVASNNVVSSVFSPHRLLPSSSHSTLQMRIRDETPSEILSNEESSLSLDLDL